MATFTVKIRRQGKTERIERESLEAALDVLEFELRALSQTERRGAVTGIGRDYAPGELVALRGEVSGRGVRAGVDVRGDGSAQAFTGRVRRQLVTAHGRESAYDALRRVLMA